MGKYMKKSQISADVALMELSQSTTSGVRTRAKTLALQRLNPDTSSSSYLQLRSRRLEKPPLLKDAKKGGVDFEAPENSDASCGKKLNCKDSSRLRKKGGGDFEESGCFSEKREMLGLQCESEDLGVEVSFGENYLDFELRERSTRESTPCSFIRDSETIGTPGSTTRQTSSTMANRRVTNNILRNIPTTHEMEEFFTCAEQEQQRLFIEKYNFDIANDLPLSGRYEWAQVIP
ncbi:cyclin-dependent kinase inhibitor 3 isoform X2 [Euphorbia lathyris]|uniref:cyclin-dependent kinase inhibitor 3 isoform X2 n=1 Tax=Euphorbia lathyris TaxID=212925 RepID=UPI0033132BAC